MRGSDNSHTQRMLRTFSTAAVTRKRYFPTRTETDNPCHRRRTFRERACFVDNQRVHFSRRSRASAFLINTPAGAFAHPHHYRHRRGQSQRAGTGNNQDRHSRNETVRHPLGPQTDQIKKATTAISITRGTNQPETLSAILWMGARERCASATI